MTELMGVVRYYQSCLKSRLEEVEQLGEGLSKEVYLRYLSMQYYLVQGVQRQFLNVAASEQLFNFKRLRAFLVKFAFEEEMHFKLALNDIRKLSAEPLPVPFYVKLWRSYFEKVIETNPFQRLGATCVLENISTPASPILDRLLQNSKYINEKNTTFLKVHKHEVLPHGDQILSVLAEERLSDHHKTDLIVGAREGGYLFMRLIEYCFEPNHFP